MKSINIIIVDDHEIFREGLYLVLSQIESFNVVATYSTGESFIEQISNIDFDIALVDINMPGIDGIETTQKAKSIKPDIKVIALTMYDEETTYLKMIENGAIGFLLKKSGKYELQQAIISVNNGGNYFSTELLQKVASRLTTPTCSAEEPLTTREKEVLIEICNGNSTIEISEKLFISPNTVNLHRARIKNKTNCKNIAQLIIWAIKNNIYNAQ